ncbi:uncharacterized protein EV420DRAFT_1473789 [Desarmillaria tabescens]|uniref:Uncharacterized protein n=1 Tax=Armillaria tabescens TaxID=1929756 RepID=A0AA39TRL7_ARMTA|nr:uncharacterized protein EV420DRAFT_1473789 [Desarmillaria tabescens]KAK0468012.1 hypothetical protein EV420DRAFT_1473789 [Desarmillaria tabescens]
MHSPRTLTFTVLTDTTAVHGCPSPSSVLFNDAAWCCADRIFAAVMGAGYEGSLRYQYHQKIQRRGCCGDFPVPPSTESSSGSGTTIRKLPVPPTSAADSTSNGAKPRTLPTPPPSPTANPKSEPEVRRLPTPPPPPLAMNPGSFTQPVRPLPLASFPTTPSVTMQYTHVGFADKSCRTRR